jgi:hypothetical protein
MHRGPLLNSSDALPSGWGLVPGIQQLRHTLSACHTHRGTYKFYIDANVNYDSLPSAITGAAYGKTTFACFRILHCGERGQHELFEVIRRIVEADVRCSCPFAFVAFATRRGVSNLRLSSSTRLVELQKQ